MGSVRRSGGWRRCTTPPSATGGGVMRILFAGYHGSVHTRRWADFFAGRGDEVHVVTCGDRAEAPRPHMRSTTSARRDPASRGIWRRSGRPAG